MKLASPALISYLATTRNLIFADLWKFTLKCGVVLAYTTWDTDITVDGVTFASHEVLIENGTLKQSRGLEVNNTDVTCTPSQGANNIPASVITVPSGVVAVYGGLMDLATTTGGNTVSIPFLQAIRAGLFDRAKAERFRLFMPTPGDISLGTVRMFLGEINSITLTRTFAKITCNDATDILNIQMPRRQYQPTCPWTFGDSNCTFDKSSTMKTDAAAAGSSTVQIACGLSDAVGTFNFGSLIFTSGANNGITRSVKSYQPGVVILTGGFPYTPSIGDTFQIFAGCSKNFSGAEETFNGSAALGSTSSLILAPLTNVAGFFNGGTIEFTTGANVGQTRTVSNYVPGSISVSSPFPNSPTLGDEFAITSISTNTTSTCTGYANTANFGGEPYVPIPETAY